MEGAVEAQLGKQKRQQSAMFLRTNCNKVKKRHLIPPAKRYYDNLPRIIGLRPPDGIDAGAAAGAI